MIIDFHAHIFPDKIASTTVSALENASGNTPYSDGTKNGLINALNEANATYAVNLPVLTKPSQFDSVTKFALSLNEEKGKIISFAGVHPDLEDIPKKMETLKNLGFKGVKIHPDYQGAFVDDDGYVQIVKEAKRNGLIVVTHAGVDEGFPTSPVRCTPQRVLSLLDKVGGYDKLVLAHLGGNRIYSEVYDLLAGLPVYFDTAYALPLVTNKQFASLVEKHGEDKILFATDSPWRSIKEEVSRIKGYGLPKTIQDKIFYQNAVKLLNL